MRPSFPFPAVLAALATVFVLSLCTLPPALADPAEKYNPAQTTVAILPVLNLTKSKHPDTDAEAQAKKSAEGNRELAEMFGKHAFPLTSPALVTEAIQTSHFDAANQASWTADNLAVIGKAAHADLVVLLVITDTHQGYRHGLLIMGGQREGEAKTKLWLVDTRTQTAVIDGVAASGKAQASAFMGWATGGMGEGSSSYVIKAIDDAVNKSLTDFFKPYPFDNNRAVKYAAPNIITQSSLTPAAHVGARGPSAPAPAAPTQSLFTFANGAQTVGTLLGFDGSIYTASTPKGMRQFKKAWITSIRALPPTPVAAPASQK